jgi:hypothetical protein
MTIEAPKLNQKAFIFPLIMATLAAVRFIKPGKIVPTIEAINPAIKSEKALIGYDIGCFVVNFFVSI